VLPQGVGGLAILFHFILFVLSLFDLILVYVHNTHQVLVGLPQEAGGLATLYFLSLF
jgi:hypothetical protein